MEAALWQAIRADVGNYQAKSKLKAIRLCRTMLGPVFIIVLVVGLISYTTAEVLHHALLGFGKGKLERARLLDFIVPNTSPVCSAQGKLYSIRFAIPHQPIRGKLV